MIVPMKARTIASLLAGMLAVTALAAVQLTNNSEPLAKRMGTTPVVVELFTSQGCNSCPPADAMLGAIAHAASLRGRAIPLAFHVAYWDHLGWRDPFSSKSWTQRQMAYVKQMTLSSASTPQLVVAGQKQLSASRPDILEQSIIAASQTAPVGKLAIQATRDANSVVANVTASDGGNTDLPLAPLQSSLPTNA